LKPPVIVAESEAEPPTAIELAESVVATVGLILFTAKGSQTPDAALLFVSPLYNPWNEYGPAVGGVVGAESGTTPPATVTELPTGLPMPEHTLLLKML
jgi:hypothetical protein